VETSLPTEAEQAPISSSAPFGDAVRFWLKLGFISFGGPAGQIAIMHRELVDQKRWIGETQFLRALNFCTLLPGPEAQQLATYMGWRLHGILGGIIAGSLFVLPSVLVLLLLSWLSVTYGDTPLVAGLFYGIQPVVIAIVIEAVLRIGKRTLHNAVLIGFAVAAFVALRVFNLPFPLVIALAGMAGLLLQRIAPRFVKPRSADDAQEEAALLDRLPPVAMPSLRRSLTLIAVFVGLWALPVGALWLWRGSDDVLFQIALFFTQAAFVTFGGAYAVLSYIADVAVSTHGWLTTEQMLQGLALAETTPGPLIMVTQYVGFLGAYNFPGSYPPLLYGTLGALVTTYTTFLPCFLFVFLGAPYIEALGRNQRLQAALVGVTAAVVGVILNLAIFFALHVLFPEGQPLDLFALLLAVGAFVVLQRFNTPIYLVVLAGGIIGMGGSIIALLVG
jgi:chromate transporter